MLRHVTVSTAAASRSLCVLATVKTELGITDSSEDTKLTRLIGAVSLAMAGPSGLRRVPWLETVAEWLPGEGGHYLLLSRWPVQTVTSVEYGTTDSLTTVTAADYAVASPTRRDRLWNEDGWAYTRESAPRPYTATDGPDFYYKATYRAGWVMPDQITEWSATASVAASAWFASTDVDEPFIFQADATGGTTGSTEPSWPTAQAGTVTDNGITWTAYDQRLPQDLEEAAMAQVIEWFRGGLALPAGIAAESFEGASIRYRDHVPGTLQPFVSTACAAYR